MSSSASTHSAASGKSIANADPVTKNALRYTISSREYELLHQYLLSRSAALRKRAPAPRSKDALAPSPTDDYNAAAIRVSVRLFLGSYAVFRVWDLALEKLMKSVQAAENRKQRFFRNPNFRLSLSISSILLFHRLLYRFFTRLRDSLRNDDAKPFRRRNPRIARALTSKIAPVVGASLSGFLLGLSAADQTRITITIYCVSRSLEFLYNAMEDKGYFRNRPWWFGSWTLMPLAFGQLLHAFVFDRECFPAAYGNFILKRSPQYIQQRPTDYPTHRSWPSTFDIVDSLAQISKLRWPTFVSPILFPKLETLPSSVKLIAPITDPAHPAIKNLSCAVLHPQDPSCLRTYISYYVQAFPPMAKFWTLIYAAFAIPRYKSFRAAPLTAFNALAKKIVRTSFFVTSAIGTAWGSICFLQHMLPRNVLPTQRWFLSGFIAGLWAFLERGGGRSNFLYSARMSMDSLWKVGKKRGYWKGVTNGDVLLFVMSMVLANVIYERNPKAVSSGVLRRSFGMLRGEGWVDRAADKQTEVRDVKATGVDTQEGAAEKKEL